MTQQDFLAFYPQFDGFQPQVVLTEAVRQANARFSDWEEPDAEEARRLYAAHRLTLYAMTVPEASSGSSAPSAVSIAAAGRAAFRAVSSKKVGEVSVSYSTESMLSSATSSDCGDLAETAYGRQLLSLLMMYSRSRYIP